MDLYPSCMYVMCEILVYSYVLYVTNVPFWLMYILITLSLSVCSLAAID